MSKRADRRRAEVDQRLSAQLRAAVDILWPGNGGMPGQIMGEQDPPRTCVVFRGEVVAQGDGSSRRYADRALAKVLAHFLRGKAQRLNRLADELMRAATSHRTGPQSFTPPKDAGQS